MAAGAAAKRQLGTTGLEVFPLCLGGNVFGWTADEATSFAVLDAFVEGGGNFVDTADVYSRWIPGHVGGESETVLGRWIASRKAKDRLVVATKVGAETALGKGLTREHIEKSVDASLRRLGVERIDLYYAHYDDPNTPFEETLRAFDALVKAGKVKALGLSNHTAERAQQALDTQKKLGLTRYQVIQPEYNLVERPKFEGALQQVSEKEGLAVAPYFGLAAGFLTGKYQEGQPAPASLRAGNVLKKYGNTQGWGVVAALKKVAERRGATPSQVALAWLVTRPTVEAPIASATSVPQVKELLGAFSLKLEADDLRELDSASSK
ncbi:aldo/keto reductase [Corallococcus exiguus]|uniref:aldo/keto reductase n=1 Tax=Corallococcus TaxID=83461 RepID=UPI000ECE1543|nr:MULTISPECIES: aldo/keto reductase [Corallococcus]NNB93497.1 aldo/keto reductase [Corallococcus exiguus]NNC05859.1 aldo/keto reductase [Corallococcus exiguus]NPC48174.1 aldo/keto reductase [Corallococcus exiguus]RKH78607.1 aldo/keto reductase [Corallococcus sp. AB032C]